VSALRRTAFPAATEAAGERLDAWLARQPGAPTRSQIKSAADDDRLQVSGKSVRASYRLRGDETVELFEHEADPAAAAMLGEDIPLDVLHEDASFLAINKPAGMVVHPGAGNRTGTLVHALLFRDPALAWPGQPERAGIVHRLDRDTSGVILVAKTVRAHEALSRQFRDRSIKKTYVALVHGDVKGPGTIDLPIGRHPTERKRMSVIGKPARAATSDYEPLERFGTFTLVEVRPRTGRTHQIRVHLSAKGWPIVGDRVYGARARSSFPRQALHAAAIELEHPEGNRRLRIEAPMAADIEGFVESLRRGRASGSRDGAKDDLE
jgi:23S rRNA pseudouridine1911/1915/1917 synthase